MSALGQGRNGLLKTYQREGIGLMALRPAWLRNHENESKPGFFVLTDHHRISDRSTGERPILIAE